jgi:uncharacterized membrane protein
MNRVLGVALLLAGLLYPFAVYFGMGHFSPRAYALLLGGLWLLRSLAVPQGPGNAWLAGGALGFCALLALVDEPWLLRWYPLLVNLMLLAVFALSLKFGPPLIERLARRSDPDLSPGAVRYTRKVTQVWVAFFIGNILLTGALALWAPLAWWTLYTGLIAYLLMGLLFAGEWLVRQRVRRVAA